MPPMNGGHGKIPPGRVRDAILEVLGASGEPMRVGDIEAGVREVLGSAPSSSIRSYLRLNTPRLFVRESRGQYSVRRDANAQIDLPLETKTRLSRTADAPSITVGRAVLYHADCFEWLSARDDESLHAVVTDPPYGLHEYSDEQQEKLRRGRGGVWRIPPSFDGHKRSPLPRFTVLNEGHLRELREFFTTWAKALLPKLTPGANVVVASNPLLSHVVSNALSDAGLERRGELVRLVTTMRGGDRPKAAHEEFDEVSVMPRSHWEPWLVYRKPLEGRVQDNLRKWKTGGFRRPAPDKPFADVIPSAPTRKQERALAPHPSLKPQAFLRQLVHAVLPLGEGIVFDPFAGSGSTLAAAEVVGYASIGTERDPHYFDIARTALPALVNFVPNGSPYKR